MGLKDILGYKFGRNLSKGILVFSALAISSFAFTDLILKFLNFSLFGMYIRNILALSWIIVALLLKDGVINMMRIPFVKNTQITKWVYYAIFTVIALGISSLVPLSLVNALNITFLDYSWLAVRNIIAVVLLISAKVINDTG